MASGASRICVGKEVELSDPEDVLFFIIEAVPVWPKKSLVIVVR
jgi:hypothetical protein